MSCPRSQPRNHHPAQRRPRGSAKTWRLALVVLLACLGVSARAAADPPEPEGEGQHADGISVAPPLAPLPEVPRRWLPEPKREDQLLLDELLQRLTSDQPGDRTVALEEVLAIDGSLLPAVKARIDQEGQKADRRAMKRLLLDTRRDARTETEKAMRQRGDKGEVETPDYFPMMLSKPKPDNEHWQRLVRVLALSRMCVQLGTVEAVRVLIHVYVRFEFLRIDTQLQLKKLGDKSLAALIETTRHKAATVSNWAKRRLDFLGKAIPSEVVQVEDAQVLSDVLRAYGRIQDPDAARLVISFANSERSQVREAARQAVALFGETANWSLRDTYENMVGKKPPREWSWDRTARELFREFDRIRLAELYGHYEAGLEALAEDDLEAARAAFDKVVARAPNFEPRDKLVEAYLRYAEQKFDAVDFATTRLEAPGASETPDTTKSDTPSAGAANTETAEADEGARAVENSLLRVVRLSPNEEQRHRAESLLLTLEAKRLSEQEIADRSLLKQALELDAENTHAKELLEELSREPFVERSAFLRWVWPAAIGVAATLFALLIAFVRLRSSATKPS